MYVKTKKNQVLLACVSKKVDWCVVPGHPPLPFKQNNMSPRIHTHKCASALRGATHVLDFCF